MFAPSSIPHVVCMLMRLATSTLRNFVKSADQTADRKVVADFPIAYKAA
jgi:hypothetical protein